MSKSEDVTKLFAMFGEKNTDQYQEIYESEQNRATRERWPVFQRIHVDADAHESVPTPSSTAKTPLPRPFAPVDRHPANPPSMVAQKGSTPTAVAKSQQPAVQAQDAPASTPGSAAMPRDRMLSSARSPTPSERLQETSGNLRALFQRLEKKAQPTAPAQPETSQLESIAAPEPPKGSIRSLFSRLSR